MSCFHQSHVLPAPVLTPDTYSYPRYLLAKKTVDARALNTCVWRHFLERLSTRGTSLRVLEVGGGVGATAERLIAALEARAVAQVTYTLVDVTEENLHTAASTLCDWADGRGYAVTGRGAQQEWRSEALSVSLRLVHADLHDVTTDTPCDALIGQAVFDLLDVPVALEALRPSVRADGLWYLPIHFDGITAFEPRLDGGLDATIERLYHESMGDGVHSGRRLLTQLPAAGADIVAAGGSDWVVHPTADGYPGAEGYFLHHVLHFVETELQGHPALSAKALAEWSETRHRQVERGTLVYIAHQLDVLAA
jgi:hypothetical protein